MYSNYNEVSETSMPVDEVEAWLNEFEHKRVDNKPTHGIIRSTESVIFVSGTRANMTKKERKAAIAHAKESIKLPCVSWLFKTARINLKSLVSANCGQKK